MRLDVDVKELEHSAAARLGGDEVGIAVFGHAIDEVISPHLVLESNG
jgi:hypothetical protein